MTSLLTFTPYGFKKKFFENKNQVARRRDRQTELHRDTRPPDTKFVVEKIQRHVLYPHEKVINAVDEIILYLKSTKSEPMNFPIHSISPSYLMQHIFLTNGNLG